MSAASKDTDLHLIDEALTGERGEDQRRIAEAGVDFVNTLLRKNRDYGSGAWERPVLAPQFAPRAAILVRMSDKVKRIGQLSGGRSPEVVDEALDDTIKDLGAYALLYLAAPEEPR